MTGFTKLWSTIVHSTVWQEPLHVKVTWVTMLALSDARGYVGASIPGLASAAGVTIEQCEESIAKFLSPDKYSRTQDFEGRRITIEDGGWRLINYEKHRAARAEEERRIQNREAQTRHRKKLTVSADADSKQGKPASAQAEAEAEAKAEAKKKTTLSGSGEPKANGVRKYKHFPVPDSDRLTKTCLTGGYVVDAGLLRKTLAPLFPESGPIHPVASLDSGLEAWLEARGSISPGKARWWTITQFAQDVGRWVRLGAMPRQDPETGAPTERGMLLAGDE